METMETMETESNGSQRAKIPGKTELDEGPFSHETDTAGIKDTENTVQATTSQPTSGRVSRYRRNGWNIIARALRSFKSRVKHRTQNADGPYNDEKDETMDDGSVESSDDEIGSRCGSLSTKGSVSAVELNGNDETVLGKSGESVLVMLLMG